MGNCIKVLLAPCKVKVAGSSASHDLHAKLKVYRRNGVQEYIVWQVYDNKLDWFQLVEGVYERMAADEQGVVKSLVFPGLYLDVGGLCALLIMGM